MTELLRLLPGSSLINEGLQLIQVIHAQSMEITPARGSEQVVDDHGGVTFASQAAIPEQFMLSIFSFIAVFVGIEELHEIFAVSG